jgi:hypothetical protein
MLQLNTRFMKMAEDNSATFEDLRKQLDLKTQELQQMTHSRRLHLFLRRESEVFHARRTHKLEGELR